MKIPTIKEGPFRSRFVSPVLKTKSHQIRRFCLQGNLSIAEDKPEHFYPFHSSSIHCPGIKDERDKALAKAPEVEGNGGFKPNRTN
jgi:hypothetical protein